MSDGRIKTLEERWAVFSDDTGLAVRATGTCQDVSQRNATEQSLRDYALRLQLAARELLTVQENERRLLARELHDTVGQELTALNVNLSLIRSAIPAELMSKLGARLDDSQGLLKDTTQNLRSIMVELRPAGLEELGLVAALRDHGRREASRNNFRVIVQGVEPHPRFDSATEIALFRIVQEAMNNISKHAQASEVHIDLEYNEGQAQLSITDNGRGFDTRAHP